MTTESRRAALQALVNAVTYAPIGELEGGAGRGYMAIVPEQFILDAQAALDSVAAPVPQQEVVAYKCRYCKDTGKITWVDYSNGQGLDIDREDDCEKCTRD